MKLRFLFFFSCIFGVVHSQVYQDNKHFNFDKTKLLKVGSNINEIRNVISSKFNDCLFVINDFYSDPKSDNKHLCISKCKISGELDLSFNSGEPILIHQDSVDIFSDLVEMDNGKFLLVVTSMDPNHHYYYTIRCFNSDGTLDLSFGNKGVITERKNNLNLIITSLQVFKNGSFVVGGGVDNYISSDMFLKAYTKNGLDLNSFGINGEFCIEGSNYDILKSIIVTPDDNSFIVCVQTIHSFKSNFYLLKFKNFEVDKSFGDNGFTHYSDEVNLFEPKYLSLDESSNIYVIGNIERDKLLKIGVKKFSKNGNDDLNWKSNDSMLVIGKDSTNCFISNFQKLNESEFVLMGYEFYNGNSYYPMIFKCDINGEYNPLVIDCSKEKVAKSSSELIPLAFVDDKIFCSLRNKFNYDINLLEYLIFEDEKSESIYMDFKLKTSPNPFNNSVKIKCNTDFNWIEVYTLNGKIVYSEKFPTTRECLINVSNLSSGTYLLSAQMEGKIIQTKKIVKE